MKKPPDHQKKGIGSALDGCSWDYTAPPLQRQFFLNPLSAFFGDFPWEGRKPKGDTAATPLTLSIAEKTTDPDVPG